MTVDTWLAKRLDYLQELKSPSATQKLLIDLASRPALSAREQRELDALVRLRKSTIGQPKRRSRRTRSCGKRPTTIARPAIIG